jgi:hypothetical protein
MTFGNHKQNALYAYESHASALSFAGAAGLPTMAVLAILMLAHFLARTVWRGLH